MNYYEHHIGDYAQATFHLTFVEDAAYSRLLRKYYAEEKPLPAELRAVQRLVGARTEEEREAVEVVLEEFFTLEEDGWHNKRADLEIAKVAEKREKASKSARARWNANASGSHANASKKDANASKEDAKAMLELEPAHDGRNALQSPDTRHQTPEQQELTAPDGAVVASKPATPDCPHGEIVALYHEILPQLRRVRDWTPDRQAFLRARWREKPERQSLAWWRGFFEYVRKCPFLVGEGATSPDREPFTADLEWLVRPTNFRKVIEGKYQPKQARAA